MTFYLSQKDEMWLPKQYNNSTNKYNRNELVCPSVSDY